MKKYFSSFALILLLSVVHAYCQNALDFDGIDDEVVVPNASSLINSGTGISLGMWVYPRNVAPNFPNFDGFGGFRNDSDADFYLVQIGATSVEARFRNSNQVNADIVFSGLLLNTWQHLVFTYDGSNIKLFHNGIEVANQAASGSITNSFESFYLGNIVYSFTDFLLDGKIDEAFLFNKALSASEIACLQHGDIDTSDASLMLYYGCNQGIAGGLNTNITTLNNFDGLNTGTLSNFALDGNSSNWVQGDIFAATEIANICAGESYTYNGTAYSTPGTYSFYFPLGNGCDSTSHFILNTITVDTSLLANNTVLTATGTATNFQWVQCDNNYSIIAGATQASYTVTANGDYAVIITNGNCVDTSRCVTVVATALNSNSSKGMLMLWPVPAGNTLTLKGLTENQNNIFIYDEMGRVIKQVSVTSKSDIYEIDITGLANGIYFLQVLDHSETKGVIKFAVLH
jgi:hypothetical protein